MALTRVMRLTVRNITLAYGTHHIDGVFMRVALIGIFICSMAAAQSKVDITAGWNYERADEQTGYANLNGWWGSVSYNVAQHLGLTFEHESYWGGYQRASTNQHVWLGGVTLKPGNSEARITPFLQPLVGDTRASSPGSITHQFTFQVAGGFDIKLSQRIALEVTPAEYVLNMEHGSPLNSYAGAVGLQFSFGH